MAVSGNVKATTAATITLSDGTGTPVTLAMTADIGDFSWTGSGHRKPNEVHFVERRGKAMSMHHGKRVYDTITFTCWFRSWEGVTSAPGEAIEFLKGIGLYAANVSKEGSGSRLPYSIDVIYAVEGTDYGDTADSTATFVRFVCDSATLTEADDGTKLAFSGRCLAVPTGDIAITEIA